MQTFRAVVTLVGSLSLCACGEASAERPEPKDCHEDATQEAPPATLEIGVGGPSNFQRLVDGASHELVLGSQGGWMPAPVFRVNAEALGTDGDCAFIDVDASVESFEPRSYRFELPALPFGDEYWFVGSLPLFLSTELEDVVGRRCSMTATFVDDRVGASAAVSVVLVDND